jgi:hypothetical protein
MKVTDLIANLSSLTKHQLDFPCWVSADTEGSQHYPVTMIYPYYHFGSSWQLEQIDPEFARYYTDALLYVSLETTPICPRCDPYKEEEQRKCTPPCYIKEGLTGHNILHLLNTFKGDIPVAIRTRRLNDNGAAELHNVALYKKDPEYYPHIDVIQFEPLN